MMQKNNTTITGDWLTDARSSKLMRVLNDGADEAQALFVGGCVRNAVIGAEVSDLDIATKLLPQEVQKRCEAAGMRVVPTGIDHGTLTIICDDQKFEVTTLRKDVATDGRRATIAFAKTWEEDAARRDFTMNTLLADIDGALYDPLGKGVDDLKQGHVVFVGNPATRIAEDILRILRFFRFHAYYGHGAPDTAALQACKDAAHHIPELSRERITQEFLKILRIENPRPTLRLMFDHGVMAELSDIDLERLQTLCALQTQYDQDSLPARLSLFEERDKLDTILRLPKATKGEIEAIQKVQAMGALTNEQAIKTALYKHGRRATMQAILIKGEALEQTVRDLIQTWDIPIFPITGQDLIQKGTKPGPELGKELKRLEEKWMENGFLYTRTGVGSDR